MTARVYSFANSTTEIFYSDLPHCYECGDVDTFECCCIHLKEAIERGIITRRAVEAERHDL